MGTRSLTFVFREDQQTPIVCMYRQFDGYPEGHGLELAQFLKPIRVVNGIRWGEENDTIANGMGCLAAQMIAHFKTTPGGIYLNTVDLDQDAFQDYEYHVYDTRVEVKSGHSKKPIFIGTWNEFYDYCKGEQCEER